MVSPQEGKTVMQNVAFLSTLQTITYILPIFILPYLFRVLGAEHFGLIAFAQAFVQYFNMITDYGFNVSASKQISLNQEDHHNVNETIASVMTIKMILLCLSAIILFSIITIVPRFNHDALVYLLSFGTVIGSALFPMWFFQGTENLQFSAKLNIIGELLFAFIIFYTVRSPEDYLMVPIATSTIALLTALAGQWILFKKFNVRLTLPSWSTLRTHLVAGWPIFISVVAINAYTNTRVFAVGLLTNNTITGFYSIAERIANAVQTFPLSSFTQAIFPRLNKIYQKNKTMAFDIMNQIQLITVIISLIFIPLTFLFAPFIVSLVCDGNYPQAVLSLRFLLIAVFFISANAFRVQFLLVSGQTKTYSTIHVRMAMMALPLIILSIYSFSYAGAAMATALIEAGIFLSTWLAIKPALYTHDKEQQA